MDGDVTALCCEPEVMSELEFMEFIEFFQFLKFYKIRVQTIIWALPCGSGHPFIRLQALGTGPVSTTVPNAGCLNC